MITAIFDMDGTLVDSMGYWRTVALEYLQERGFQPSDELRDEVYKTSVRKTPAIFRRHFDIQDSDADMNAFFDARMAQHYRNDIGLKPGAAECLERLRAAGVECVLATATWRTETMPLIARLGIERYFTGERGQMIVCRDEMGMMKSDERYYPSLCARFGLEAGECVMFEDALYSMINAHAAGLRVWAIMEPTAVREHQRIRDIAEQCFDGWDEIAPGAQGGLWDKLLGG